MQQNASFLGHQLLAFRRILLIFEQDQRLKKFHLWVKGQMMKDQKLEDKNALKTINGDHFVRI